VIFFVFYAGLVWYGALKRRREVMGFVYTMLGVLGVAVLGYVHYLLNIWSHGALCLPVLQSLLYPFGVLILAMGLFLACLPPRYSGSRCRSCGYDLRGLETDDRVCPECATRHVLFHGAGEPCRACHTPLKAREWNQAVCTRCGTVHLMIGRSRQSEPDFDRDEHVREFDTLPEPPARQSIRERLRRWSASRPSVERAEHEHQRRQPEDHRQPDEFQPRR